MAATAPLQVRLNPTTPAETRKRIEGPTRKEALKMAARRVTLLAMAREAVEQGQDDRGFRFDCEAWDIEVDLQSYGFDITGRPVR